MAGDTPAGWYPAPDSADLVRYWDGEMWTESARPAPKGRAGSSGESPGRPNFKVERSEIVNETLRPSETLEAGVGYGRKMIVATTERLLLFDPEGIRRRYEIHEFSYDDVETIGYSQWSGVNVIVNGETYKCPTAMPETDHLIQYVRARMPRTGPIDLASLPRPKPAADDDSSESTGTPAEEDPDADSLAGRIREVATLHAEGILSDEEFAAAKAKLLDL